MRTGAAARARGSGFVRHSGVDGEGVDSSRHQGVQGIIYEAVAGNRRQAFETRAGDADAEMTAFTRPGMADMKMAVVLDLQRRRRQRGAQRRLDVRGGDAQPGLVSAGTALSTSGRDAAGSSSSR